MEITSEAPPRLALFQNRALMTLMLGHFTVDMYAGLLPVLYPLLIGRFTLDLKTVGLVSLAYTGTASVVQPAFGWIADRTGTRFIGLALIWTAVMFAGIGFAPTFPILLLMASLAGLGSGAYHPFGALNAGAVIEDRERNTAMSVYVTGGTVGVALGPLLGIVLFGILGTPGTLLAFLPGASIAVWLLYELRGVAHRHPKVGKRAGAAAAPIPLGPMIVVVGIMMSRSWTTSSLQAFIPSWYHSLGYAPSFYGPLATTLVLASAAGAIGAGTLADRLGRRGVILGSIVLTVPALLLVAQFTGPIAFVTLAIVGLSAASSGPLLIVLAQQLMRGRAGVASGLILGIGFVTGAIGIPITGALADAYGMQMAIRAQVILVAATFVLAWFLPGEARLRALATGSGKSPI